MTSTTTESNKAAVRRLYEEMLNTGNVEQLSELIDEAYTGLGNGPEGFAQVVAELRAAFPDIVWRLDEVMAEGEKVTVRWTWRGTHKGSFKAYAASGHQVTNEAIAIYEFKAGKIIRSWLQSDRLGVLQQIRAIP